MELENVSISFTHKKKKFEALLDVYLVEVTYDVFYGLIDPEKKDLVTFDNKYYGIDAVELARNETGSCYSFFIDSISYENYTYGSVIHEFWSCLEEGAKHEPVMLKAIQDKLNNYNDLLANTEPLLSLDEAITKYSEPVSISNFVPNGEERAQIAKWLCELRELRNTRGV